MDWLSLFETICGIFGAIVIGSGFSWLLSEDYEIAAWYFLSASIAFLFCYWIALCRG